MVPAILPFPTSGLSESGVKSRRGEEGAAMIQLEVGLKKAIEWISDSRQEKSAVTLAALIDEACRKFDLSPVQADFLYRHFTQ